MPRVTIWNEYRHERHSEKVAQIYPKGIHGAIADIMQAAGISARTATLDEPEHGLTEEVLAETDVLFWWGHTAHREVDDAIVARVCSRVYDGMGFVALHSAHASKPFSRLMGMPTDRLRWRESGDLERFWVLKPNHPIAAGIGEFFELEHEETYGEVFCIPEPDELVFMSWFSGGEVFRSGCCWTRGQGRVFYFQPGHESFPSFYDKNVQRVLVNAALWAAPVDPLKLTQGHTPVPLSK